MFKIKKLITVILHSRHGRDGVALVEHSVDGDDEHYSGEALVEKENRQRRLVQISRVRGEDPGSRTSVFKFCIEKSLTREQLPLSNTVSKSLLLRVIHQITSFGSFLSV